MSIVALFITVENWKQARYLPTGEWINKLWYIYTQGIILSNRKGMDYWYTQHGWISKKIILREETCPKELSTLMIPYIWHSRVNQTILSIEGKRLPYWIPLGRWGHRLTGMWRETFWSNVYILYHDTGLDSTGMCRYQNSVKGPLKISTLYCMQTLLQNSKVKRYINIRFK